MKGKAREPRGATIAGGPLMENEVRERKIKRLLDARARGKEKYGVVIQHEKDGVIVGKLVEIGENNEPSYIQHDMVTLKIIPADAAHDLNALADSLGLSFEEAAARLTAGRKEDTPLRRARRVVRNFDYRRAHDPDLRETPEVLEARSFVNRANYRNRRKKKVAPPS